MLLTRADGNATQYWCHPHHMHSTGNAWQQIFGGVYLNAQHTTNLAQVRAWVVGYVPGVDGLSLLPGAFGDLFYSEIVANTTGTGVLTLNPIGPDKRYGEYFGSPPNFNTSYVSNDVWGSLLQALAYKLLPDPYNCDDYVGTTKTFGLQVTNRFGRTSSAVYVQMVVSTAGILFTDQDPVLVTDDILGDVLVTSAAASKLSFGPVSRGLNVSFLLSN
jgi:hypothetical protein